MRAMFCTFALTLLLGLTTIQAIAQTPAATGPLYEGFLDPPHDFSPMPFWFWNGKMEGPVIQQEIRDMTSQHVYGAFLHGRDGLGPLIYRMNGSMR